MFIFVLTESRLFYSMVPKRTNFVPKQTNSFFKKTVFYIGCRKWTKIWCRKRVPKLVDTVIMDIILGIILDESDISVVSVNFARIKPLFDHWPNNTFFLLDSANDRIIQFQNMAFGQQIIFFIFLATFFFKCDSAKNENLRFGQKNFVFGNTDEKSWETQKIIDAICLIHIYYFFSFPFWSESSLDYVT